MTAIADDPAVPGGCSRRTSRCRGDLNRLFRVALDEDAYVVAHSTPTLATALRNPYDPGLFEMLSGSVPSAGREGELASREPRGEQPFVPVDRA